MGTRKIKIPQQLEGAYEFWDAHLTKVTLAEVEVHQICQSGQSWTDLTLESEFAKVELDDTAGLLASSNTAPITTVFASP